MTVVEDNNIELLKIFLKYSPDLNYVVEDGDEDTLLHMASRNNYIEIARLLLAQKGIDTSIVNEEGQTALDVATTDEMRALFA